MTLVQSLYAALTVLPALAPAPTLPPAESPGGSLAGSLGESYAGRLLDFQGPDTGSPFVNAPLPFEALKAPPDSAFEILMLSLGVMFLAGLATAAFLALSKLRSMEEALTKELRALRHESQAGRESAGGAAPGSSGERLDRAAFDAGIERLDHSIAQLGAVLQAAAAASAAAPRQEAVQGTHESLQPMVDALTSASAEQRDALSRLADGLAALRTSGTDSAAMESALAAAHSLGAQGSLVARRAAMIDRVHTRLALLGFTDVEIVTTREEIDDDQLASGELIVEGRRSGTIHKGIISLEAGSPIDVRMRPTHSIFP